MERTAVQHHNPADTGAAMRVEEIMSRPARTCFATDSLNVPAQLMWDCDIGCIIVVDDEDRPVGLVTDRDLCMAAYTTGKPLQDIPAHVAMAQIVHSCPRRASLRAAMEIMRTEKLHRLPVLDESGRAIGLVSMSDLVREAKASDYQEVIEAISLIVEPRTPGAIVIESGDSMVAA